MSNVQNEEEKSISEYQKKCIENLRQQINSVNNIKNINTDDEYLLRFLYATDFDIVQALSRMKEYHQNILDYPEWYTKDSPIDRKSFIDSNTSVIIPSACDKNGKPIYLLKLGNVDSHTITITDEAALEDIWFEYIVDKHPEICGKGICIILDFEGVSWKFATKFNYQKFKLFLSKLRSTPLKDLQIHLVNNSRVIKLCLNVLGPFIPAESKKQIHWSFTDWEGLYKHIEKDLVPPEYGGYNKLNYKKINEKLYEKSDIILGNFKLYRSVTKNE